MASPEMNKWLLLTNHRITPWTHQRHEYKLLGADFLDTLHLMVGAARLRTQSDSDSSKGPVSSKRKSTILSQTSEPNRMCKAAATTGMGSCTFMIADTVTSPVLAEVLASSKRASFTIEVSYTEGASLRDFAAGG